jgi:hypothetical protein
MLAEKKGRSIYRFSFEMFKLTTKTSKNLW